MLAGLKTINPQMDGFLPNVANHVGHVVHDVDRHGHIFLQPSIIKTPLKQEQPSIIVNQSGMNK